MFDWIGRLFGKKKFKFPSDIKGACHGAKNGAKTEIENRGTKLKVKKGCTVKKHAGQRKISGMWCWIHPDWGLYVAGLCWGERIEVGCHPQTGGDVGDHILKHEFGHYWLMTNFGDHSHNPKYRGGFYAWKEVRTRGFAATAENDQMFKARVIAELDQKEEGEVMSVSGVDQSGVPYNIDFVATQTAEEI